MANKDRGAKTGKNPPKGGAKDAKRGGDKMVRSGGERTK